MTLNSKNCAKTQLATVSTILCCLRDKDKKRKMQRFMTRAKNTFFRCSLCPNPCALFPNAMCFKKNQTTTKTTMLRLQKKPSNDFTASSVACILPNVLKDIHYLHHRAKIPSVVI